MYGDVLSLEKIITPLKPTALILFVHEPSITSVRTDALLTAEDIYDQLSKSVYMYIYNITCPIGT